METVSMTKHASRMAAAIVIPYATYQEKLLLYKAGVGARSRVRLRIHNKADFKSHTPEQLRGYIENLHNNYRTKVSGSAHLCSCGIRDVNRQIWGHILIGNSFLHANYVPRPATEPSSFLGLLTGELSMLATRKRGK
jgi:hypothetical protein